VHAYPTFLRLAALTRAANPKETAMRVILAIAAVMMTAVLAPKSADAAATVRMGSLECNVSGETGFIVGSKAGLDCQFKRANGTVEDYDGSITKLGLDVGFTAETVLIWAVFAPSTQLTPGAIEGRYYGVQASATAGVGVGANVLVGGFDRAINLQPLSVQGQTGVDVAAGVAEMHLRYVAPPTK